MEEIKKITIPESWEEVSLGLYQKIDSLRYREYHSDVAYFIDIIDKMGIMDKGMLLQLDVIELNKIAQEIGWVVNLPEIEEKTEVEIDGQVFRFKSELEKMTVGEAISIEMLMDSGKQTEIESIDIVLSVLLRPIDENGEMEEFNADLVDERRELFLEKLSIVDVYGFIIFFYAGVGNSTILNSRGSSTNPL